MASIILWLIQSHPRLSCAVSTKHRTPKQPFPVLKKISQACMHRASLRATVLDKDGFALVPRAHLQTREGSWSPRHSGILGRLREAIRFPSLPSGKPVMGTVLTCLAITCPQHLRLSSSIPHAGFTSLGSDSLSPLMLFLSLLALTKKFSTYFFYSLIIELYDRRNEACM